MTVFASSGGAPSQAPFQYTSLGPAAGAVQLIAPAANTDGAYVQFVSAFSSSAAGVAIVVGTAAPVAIGDNTKARLVYAYGSANAVNFSLPPGYGLWVIDTAGVATGSALYTLH